MTTYSVEQEKIALDILSKDKHQFYDILNIEKSANDNEVKKAYRKLAIKLHPDKNPHPRASEAFKVINRAFEVLGNDEKRRIFDQIGRDPDDRSVPAASSSGFSSSRGETGFPMGFEEAFFRNRHATTAGAASPEDIFDFLFNMGAGGPSPFGGHPFMNDNATTFTFGPGGFRAYGAGPRGATRRQQARNAQRQQEHDTESQWQDIVRVLIPLMFFFLLPVLEKLLFGEK